MRLETSGTYPPDWPAIAMATRRDAGFRCVRCGHRFVPRADARAFGLEPSGGEWSACDDRCTHLGPVRIWVPDRPGDDAHWIEEFTAIPVSDLTGAGWRVDARWRILTVHHLNGDKADCRWWNLLALCQVCHLIIQAKVVPERPWLFDHSEWFKPYVAGFYASYYGGQDITRAEAIADLPRWLALNPAVT